MNDFKKTAFLLFLSFSAVINGLSQTNSPNSFQDLKLGMSFTEFKLKYPDFTDCSFFVGLNTGIILDSIKMYGIGTKTTSSGDNVSVCVGFYLNKMVLIDVGYFGYVEKGDLLDGLTSKFGKYSHSKSTPVRDWTNGQYRTFVNYYWKNNPNNILVFSYILELGYGHIIYLDKKTQQKLKEIKTHQNIKKID